VPKIVASTQTVETIEEIRQEVASLADALAHVKETMARKKTPKIHVSKGKPGLVDGIRQIEAFVVAARDAVRQIRDERGEYGTLDVDVADVKKTRKRGKS
jgi:hypothetical protein